MNRSSKQGSIAQRLSAERIAEAALALIEAEGRSALSMRSLAASLGCEAMSLYHHVDGIEGVLDAVVERLLASIVLKDDAGLTPREALHAQARAFFNLAELYPEAFPLVPTRLWSRPGSVAAASAMFERLRAIGLGEREAQRQGRVLGAYLNGAGMALAAWCRKDGAAERIGRSAAADPLMAPVSASVNREAVRADLDAGLEKLLKMIG